MKKQYLFLLLLFTIFLPGLGAETGEEIIQKVIDGQKVTSSAMDIRMVLADKDGVAGTRRIQTLVADNDGLTKMITLFLEPASVKNTHFLTVQNKPRKDDL